MGTTEALSKQTPTRERRDDRSGKAAQGQELHLIAVLYYSSDNVASLKSYIQDAEAEGDQELVEFFGGLLENNLRAAQRAKEILVPRFQSEQE